MAMTNSNGASATGAATLAAAPLNWTCGRCDMTVSWMPKVENPKLPGSWVEQDGEVFCLACRRELAAEAAELLAPDRTSLDDRRKLRGAARIEFEIDRDPDRADGSIARACHTSIFAVKKARTKVREAAELTG